jgi:hypothetical protein
MEGREPKPQMKITWSTAYTFHRLALPLVTAVEYEFVRLHDLAVLEAKGWGSYKFDMPSKKSCFDLLRNRNTSTPGILPNSYVGSLEFEFHEKLWFKFHLRTWVIL